MGFCCHEKEEHAAERWGWWFSGFALGPAVVNATFWGVAIIHLASLDAHCNVNPSDGLSSGADGLDCTADHLWNEDLFLSLNGSACLKTVGLQTSYHNLPNPLCQGAFTSYRAAPGPTEDFTCNCTESPYSFLTGGTRPTNVITVSTIFINIIIAFTLPVLGVWSDRSPYRRQLYFACAIGTGITVGMGSVLATGYVWIIGLTSLLIAAMLYEFAFLGLAPYLAEITDSDADRGKISGLRQVASLSAQLLFAITVAGVGGLALNLDDVMLAIFANIICGCWLCGLVPLSAMSLSDRCAAKPSATGQGMIRATFSALSTTFWEAKEYPETFKFLIMHMFCDAGIGSMVTQLPTYAVAQLQLDSTEIVIIVMILLVTAMGSALFYSSVLSKRIGPKAIQILCLVWMLAANCIFALFVHRPRQFTGGLVAGVVTGIGLGAYYSSEISNLMKLVPGAKKSEFVALYGTASYLPRFIPPLVYASIVQQLNDHQIAMLTLSVYILLGLVVCLFVDFEKGQAEAEGRAGVGVSDLRLPLTDGMDE